MFLVYLGQLQKKNINPPIHTFRIIYICLGINHKTTTVYF